MEPKGCIDNYRLQYKQLVLKISRQLSFPECEGLFFVYKEKARLPVSLQPSSLPAGDDRDVCALRLLEALEQAREFSYSEPCKLKAVMSYILREDLAREVELFLGTHSEVTEQFQSNYSKGCTYAVVRHRFRPPVRKYSRNTIGQPPYQQRPLPPTPTSSDSDGSDSGDESPYEKVHPPIIASTFQGSKIILKETVRLLVRPVRTMITENKWETLSTGSIPTYHSSVSSKILFQLRILCAKAPNDKLILQSGSNFISAELYLLSDTLFPESFLLKASIKISLPKQKECLCERNAVLDLPTAHGCDFDNLCVASFPNLISHKDFKDENLVPNPYLKITLCINSC